MGQPLSHFNLTDEYRKIVAGEWYLPNCSNSAFVWGSKLESTFYAIVLTPKPSLYENGEVQPPAPKGYLVIAFRAPRRAELYLDNQTLRVLEACVDNPAVGTKQPARWIVIPEKPPEVQNIGDIFPTQMIGGQPPLTLPEKLTAAARKVDAAVSEVVVELQRTGGSVRERANIANHAQTISKYQHQLIWDLYHASVTLGPKEKE